VDAVDTTIPSRATLQLTASEAPKTAQLGDSILRLSSYRSQALFHLHCPTSTATIT